MQNTPNLSKRAARALDILADGGQFVHRLERNSYTGRDQFKHRLISNGTTHKGYGHAAFYELQDAGMIAADAGGTSVSTYYKLATV